jgi:hypothetical protein
MKKISAKMNFSNFLTLLFIGLKLAGVITWSWFWVLSPTIFQIAFVLVGLGILSIVNRKNK